MLQLLPVQDSQTMLGKPSRGCRMYTVRDNNNKKKTENTNSKKGLPMDNSLGPATLPWGNCANHGR